ncbi:MAG: twin-arginine translocase TatA/TatE family subunit [Sulfobacillus acidophilus]|uniref:Sec-independent protein translocase protein TatA n=1 Tax=Sulfobacillus acidophilus TaxID=53633 RepID=A0A2T2WEV2_9FIRM|nr:MAG: twin-arginine translocase TatA/TatE family subunit [Sulfobacillus acidophilus]
MDILSPIHIIILLIIALLVFGPKRLPEIGAGLGKSIREFKQSMNGIMDEPETPKASHGVTEYPAQIVIRDDSTPE